MTIETVPLTGIDIAQNMIDELPSFGGARVVRTYPGEAPNCWQTIELDNGQKIHVTGENAESIRYEEYTPGQDQRQRPPIHRTGLADLSDDMSEGRLKSIRQAVEVACQKLLTALEIDFWDDPNMKNTPKRMAKLYVDEVFRGKYHPCPPVVDFPNTHSLDQIYTVGPINIRSTCAHHFAPIIGKAWFGVLPGERVIGLSKFARIAHWVFSRPIIQEDATVLLADKLEQLVQPKGLGVVIEAEHLCMSWRGVKETDSLMTTSVMRGVFLSDPSAKAEFLGLIKKS